MAVTGRMSLIRKLPLVAAIYEQAAVRVSYAFRDHASLVFLPAGQLFSGGIVLLLLRRHWRLIIVIESLLSVCFPVRVCLLHQLLRIVPGCRRYRGPDLFFCVGIGFLFRLSFCFVPDLFGQARVEHGWLFLLLAAFLWVAMRVCPMMTSASTGTRKCIRRAGQGRL